MKNFINKINDLSDEKKCVGLLVATVFMGFLLFYTYVGEAAGLEKNEHEGIIRLHVIANSNSAEDQALKLEVRDAVIEYMDSQETLADVNETREYLKDNLNRLETIADGIIAAEGYDYTAKANIGIRYIPEKTYGDITFPAGNYEAVNIVLGEGEGENWWCVLFPPLCLLDEGSEEASGLENLSDEEIAKLSDEEIAKLSDEESLQLTSAEKQRLQLRWKLLEMLK